MNTFKNHQEIDTSSERVDEIKLPPLPEPLCNLPGYCRDAIAHYTKAAIDHARRTEGERE